MKPGWTEAALAEVAKLNPPMAERPANDDEVAFVPMAGLDASTARTDSVVLRRFGEVSTGYSQFLRGDLLVARITPCFENGKIGRATITTPVGAGSTEFHVVRPDPARLDAGFALHFLRQPVFRERGTLRMTGSAGQRRVPESFLARLRIPLPSLDEQRRIARILDLLDTVRRRRHQSIGLYSSLVRAIFPSSGSGGHRVTLSDVLERIDSGRSPVCESRPVTDGEWGVLKLGAVSSGEYRPLENKAMIAGRTVDERYEVHPGDVLLARKNTIDLVGASAYVRETPRRLLLPDLIFRLVPREDSRLRPVYLQAALARPSSRSAIARLAGGSAGSMPNISKQRLMKVEIDRPPLAVQIEFERRVEEIHGLRARSRVHLEQLDALFASLQQRAFTGAL